MTEFDRNIATGRHADAFRFAVIGFAVPFAGEVRPFDPVAVQML